MTHPQYDSDTIARLRSLVKDCRTWLEARAKLVKELGIAADNVTRMNRKHGFWSAPAGVTGEVEVSIETERIQTMDEVVAACKVDLDRWEPKGFNIRRGKTGFGWSARFAEKKVPVNLDKLTAQFAKQAAAHAPSKWNTERVTPKNADCIYVLNVHDQHMGKLADSVETGGANWDIRIAERVYRETVQELITKAPVNRIEEVVVIVGSDMLQVDTDQSTTTAGTYVDSDTRLSKIFDVAAKMLTDVIEELGSRFKVRVIVMPGNHDSITSHFLGRYVEAWFHKHPNVKVDAAPRSRKYVGYGKTLIAFDHGDETKLSELPLIVMRENQSTISQYRFTEVLVGHYHAEQSDDLKGIVVRVAPALCSIDKWHSRKGYVGAIRRSQGLLYQRENGLEAIYYSAPLD